VRAHAAAPPHQVDSRKGLESAYEYRARLAFGAGHGVEAPVHPVNEVHVGRAWRTIKGIGPHGATRGSVAGEIMLAEIRLRFDDPAACRAVARSTLEDGAEKVARDDLRRPIVELTREDVSSRFRWPRRCDASGQLSVFGAVFLARARR